ncbi:MAG: TrkH family potassium uptake protein [Candidatus Marinimicrobia bacterium]|nr:TrkH family potassium uptake protein [Candidatus Neomarinimicrobiota bacterium]MCF7905233.1 TrkH family potassium uptake protein [Candidatus Neomarinimicrobiota bacterium]
MRFFVVLRYVSYSLPLLSVFLLLSSIIAFLQGGLDTLPLVYTTCFTVLFGLFPLIFIPPIPDVSNKEGTLIVVFSWLVACGIGAIPYILYGGPFTVTNAFFESVSGFTTTGSTILVDIEALPQGLLFWRSATHWIGGIGIVIFVVSLLPFLGFSEVVLFRSEISTLAQQSLQGRARHAVRILVNVYTALTLLETICLLLAGMGLFDAVTHSFATIATGGFSPRNASVAHFNSPTIEGIIMLFMIFSGLPFYLLFGFAINRSIKPFWGSSAVRFYLVSMLIGIVLATLNQVNDGMVSLWTALRHASFNILSVGTSTGFASADTSIWPHASRLILLWFTLQCACAGSTSGGIKVDRIVLALKGLGLRITQIMRPRAYVPMKLDREVVDVEYANHAVVYITLYLVILVVGSLCLSLLGVGLVESFSGAAACMGNVGPGLGGVGSIGNFNFIPETGKWVLSLLMLLGRLEIFALLIVFTPMQWSRMKGY